MVYFERFAVVVPMSASMIPLSAFCTFIIWLFITLVAAWSWFELAPRLPRRAATAAIALLMSVRAVWAEAAVVSAVPFRVRLVALTAARFTVMLEVPALLESLMKTVRVPDPKTAWPL